MFPYFSLNSIYCYTLIRALQQYNVIFVKHVVKYVFSYLVQHGIESTFTQKTVNLPSEKLNMFKKNDR